MTATDSADPAAATFGEFLDALAARTAVPAGGAAAGFSAAFGAALFAMVARFTTGGRFGDVEAEMVALVDEALHIERDALDSVADDREAFGAVVDAFEMPKDGVDEQAARSAAIQAAMVRAVEPPLRLGALCTRLGEIAVTLVGRANPNVVSDVATGAACVCAALDGTLVNLEANGAVIRDEQVRARLAGAVGDLLVHRDALRRLVDEARHGLRGV